MRKSVPKVGANQHRRNKTRLRLDVRVITGFGATRAHLSWLERIDPTKSELFLIFPGNKSNLGWGAPRRHEQVAAEIKH